MQLPNDIIREIARHLDDEYDYVHFIKTCRRFRSAAADPRRINQGWLIFRYYYDDICAALGASTNMRYILDNRNFTLRFIDNNLEKFARLMPNRKEFDEIWQDVRYWRAAGYGKKKRGVKRTGGQQKKIYVHDAEQLDIYHMSRKRNLTLEWLRTHSWVMDETIALNLLRNRYISKIEV